PRPGRLERIAVNDAGEPGTQFSQYPDMSPDGRFVVFASESTNLVAGDKNENPDVFLRDRLLRTTERVSLTDDDHEPNGISTVPSVSADGRYVAFASAATNIVPEATIQRWQVYVRDRLEGTTELISAAPDGTPGNDTSSSPVITPDGRYVAFDGFASNLVPNDANLCSLGAQVESCVDVFVHDRQNDTTELVSRSSAGANGNGWSSSPDISADGRYVVFHSESNNLVPDDNNLERDVFVFDRTTSTLERVSVGSDERQANDKSHGASISADGRIVAFESSASNLVPRDTNGVQVFVGTPIFPTDIFVRDRERGSTERIGAATGAEPNDWSIQPTVSANGRYVAFHSIASNLVPGDGNDTVDIFVHDRATGGLDRATVADGGTEQNHWSANGNPDITADGSEVVFATDAWNLVPGGVEGERELLVRLRGPAVGVGEARAARDATEVTATGWVTFSGHAMAAAADPVTDGADAIGGELTGGAVVVRPEHEDLLIRLDLTSIAGVRPPPPYPVGGGLPGWAGAPGVYYGARLTSGGVTWEARAGRPAGGATPGSPTLTLHRCEVRCELVATLAGSYGNVGEDVRFSIPRSTVGIPDGASVSTRLFVAAGDPANGGGQEVDAIDLGTATVPGPSVSLGRAPQGAGPPPGAGFDTAAAIDRGTFHGRMPLGVGEVAWARACLGSMCGEPVRAVGS
ncbi:MAG TPA: hypothetical protein VEC15_00285, partial [Actinomycetota bacterium]|nr:hypothetical protein [Actinomycetota bacterium]